MKRRKSKALPPWDRYYYYSRAVQSPEVDCEFIERTYKTLRDGERPYDLREDFCGTFLNCCTWVKHSAGRRAIGIDLDPEPVAYGVDHYLKDLTPEQQARIQLIEGSVLTTKVRPVDVVVAFNFSYYLFKTRLMLRQYFKRAYKGLNKNGIFIVDCFGGPDCQAANEETTKHRGFEYFWDQKNFNPITGEAKFYIHFKREGERKRERVFTYDWRMWTVPEIREVLLEAGFRKTHVYWEGTAKNGLGNGIFRRSEKGDEVDGWVAYVVGEP